MPKNRGKNNGKVINAYPGDGGLGNPQGKNKKKGQADAATS